MSEKRQKDKGKRNKGRAGGSRFFVASAEEMQHRNEIEHNRQLRRKARRDEDSEDDDDVDGEEGEEVESEEESGGVTFAAERPAAAPAPPVQEELPTRKVVGVNGLIEVENPNYKKQPQEKMMKAKDIKENVEAKPLTRREREAIEKARAEAEWKKRHLAGQTEEAKKDLERLAEIRRRRDEAQKRRKEDDEAEKQRKEAASGKGGDDSEDELDSIKVKKMNPSELKNALKKRGLSVQGNKKDLTQRLLDSLS